MTTNKNQMIPCTFNKVYQRIGVDIKNKTKFLKLTLITVQNNAKDPTKCIFRKPNRIHPPAGVKKGQAMFNLKDSIILP